jgi:ribosomal protein S18 acetylase RimI-like enzyme
MALLRQLTEADAAMLAKIGGKTLLESHGHSAPAEVMQEYVDRSFSEQACRTELSNPGNVFYGAFHNSELVGYSKVILSTPHPAVTLQPVTKLERLYLLEEFHGLKLGQQLLQQAIAFSKAAGEKGVWLDVWKGNEKAIRFYQKHRFEIIAESNFALTASRVNPIWVMLLRY